MRRFIITLVVVATGCATSSHSRDEYVALRQKSLRTVAAFDMGCPSEQLGLTLLGGSWNTVGTQVGVEGCGVKVRYVSSHSGWVANTAAPLSAP